MSAVTRVGTVIVPVSDQDRALEFYVGTLGFEVRIDGAFGDGGRWLEVAPPGAATTLALVPGRRDGGEPRDRGRRRRPRRAARPRASRPTRSSCAWATTCRRCSRSATRTATGSAWSSATRPRSATVARRLLTGPGAG